MNLINPRNDKEPEQNRTYRLQYKMKEAAWMLHTSENTLMKWIKEYDIPYYKIGGKGDNFVLHKDLEVLIRRGAIHYNMQYEEFAGEIYNNWNTIDDKGSSTRKEEPQG